MFIQSKNPGLFLASLKALHEGLQASLPAASTQLIAGGKVSSLADLQAEVAGYVALYQATADASEAYVLTLQAREAAAVTAYTRYHAIINAIRAMMGPKNPGLSTYGILPTKTPAPLTGAQITARAAKAKATRIARGTRGKRQRAAIKGEPAVVTSAAAAADTATH